MLPEWMPQEPWEAYLSMRKSMGKKYIATEYAQKLLIAKLDGWRKEGYDVTAIIHQSIENSWQGLFLIKQTGYGVAEKPRKPQMTTMVDLPRSNREIARMQLQKAIDASKVRH